VEMLPKRYSLTPQESLSAPYIIMRELRSLNDAYGSLTQEEYYDADGNRINCRDGYSIKENIITIKTKFKRSVIIMLRNS
jgi:hypothetical protein